MNTNETIEYEIPTEEEWDVSVQGAERRGYRAGVKTYWDACLKRYNKLPGGQWLGTMAYKDIATQLLAEQEKK